MSQSVTSVYPSKCVLHVADNSFMKERVVTLTAGLAGVAVYAVIRLVAGHRRHASTADRAKGGQSSRKQMGEAGRTQSRLTRFGEDKFGGHTQCLSLLIHCKSEDNL